MDREQLEFHQRYQTGLGCGFFLVAGILTAVAMWQFGVTNLVAWLFGPLGAALGGFVLGVLLSRRAVKDYYQDDRREDRAPEQK